MQNLIWLLVVILALAVMTSISNMQEEAKPVDRKSLSRSYCQKEIMSMLKTPSTAKMPHISLNNDVTEEKENLYFVRSYVDAQNVFGAMIRNNFACKVSFVGGEIKDIKAYFTD